MEIHEYEKTYIFDKIPDKKKDYLGGGGFGQVFKALIKDTDERRAVKIIDKNRIREDYKKEFYKYPSEEEIKPYFEDLKDEIKYMEIMEGPNKDNENTVKFDKYFEYKDIFVIVMEYCNSSLLDYFATRNTFTVEEIRDFLTQLNNSFKIMNENRIAHRDLSLENILIKYRNNDNRKIIYKLTDYGVSKKLLSLSKKFSTKVGKLDFMAPEILNITKSQNQGQNEDKKKYDQECDLWSLGIIIHILFFRNHPFSGKTEIAITNKINLLQKKGIGDTKDELLNDLLLQLLEKDPTKRIKWKDYFEHPFFKQNKKSNNYVLITIAVGKKDKKENEFKDIYFLDNKPNMESKTNLYKENEEIKKLTDNDVELYINEEKQQKFSKYFKPDKEGDYNIKIIFKKKIKDCSFMFSGCDNIKKIDLSSFDSSEVTNMYYMFGKCHYLQEIKLDNLNTENVTDMSYMFNVCSELEKIVFPKSFNTKKVTNIEFMFHNCYELNDISFGDFNTENVQYMRGLFGNCFKLKIIDISKFNTNKVTDMSYMFNKCNHLEELMINPKTFISKETKNMARMFEECNSLRNINLSSLNSEKVEYLNFMFKKCENLKNIDLSSLTILDNTNLINMFDGCSNLEKLDLSSLKIGDNNKIDNMFDEMTKIKEIKVNANSINTFKATFKEMEAKFIAD
jgi:surface protein